MRVIGRWALWALISLVVITVLFRAIALRWWRVPDDDPYLEASIAPTLRGGDLVLLWRLTPPGLGQLVLCPEPKHASRETIGRMVGEEEETVVVEGSRVTIDGRAYATEGSCANKRFKVAAPQNGSELEQTCSLEVANGLLHERGNAESSADVTRLEIKIGEGEVALVSDNRRFPYDSRDFGPVSRQTCKETVFFRVVGSQGFFDSATRFQYIR
ncbi:MAG TPA: signal peptidase I [Polyangiaceae bacterium]